MADDRYERITWRGFTFDRYTVAAIEAAEDLLGFKLTIAQGSYNTTVSASAGTHDGGGAVDVMPTDRPARVVRALRTVGFAAWHRLPSQGPWGEHIHAVQIGNARLAPVAARQVTAYRNGRDGLADNAPDPTWRPNPIPTFNYQEDWLEMASKDDVKAAVVEALNEALGKATVLTGPKDASGKYTPEHVNSVLRRILNKIGA